MILLDKNQQTLTEKNSAKPLPRSFVRKYVWISFRFQYSALRFFLLGFSHQFKMEGCVIHASAYRNVAFKYFNVHIKITISKENPRTISRKIRQMRLSVIHMKHCFNSSLREPGHIHTRFQPN